VGSLDTVQQEQLRAIGTYLSQIRQEQSRSLEDIAAKTYIPLRLLKAIEAGQEKPLPEPVFIQGFIRRYADALGLDGMDLSQKFPVHVTPLPTMASTSLSREVRVRDAVEPSYRQPQIEESPPGQVPTQRQPYLPYLVAAGLLVLGGIALTVVRAISSKQPEATKSAVVLPKQPAPVASPSVSPPRPPASPKASPSLTATSASPSPSIASSPSITSSPASPAIKSSPTSTAPVSVEMNLTGDSWVQVIVDGEVKAEETLPKGTRRSWSGKKEITILAGNAGAVSISQNGENPKAMGALGDVTEKKFTPKSSL
jgi:cytoskeleton protein RodZ